MGAPSSNTQAVPTSAEQVGYFDGQETKFAGRIVGGFQTLTTGQFYTGSVAAQHNTDLAFTNQRHYANYFPVIRETQFVGIGVNVGTGEAAKVARLGIYTDASGLPSALVLDAGTVTIAAAGAATIVISQWLGPGMYWITCTTDATGTAQFVSAQNTFDSCLGAASGTANLATYCYAGSVDPASALPDPFGSVSFATTRKPWLYLEVA